MGRLPLFESSLQTNSAWQEETMTPSGTPETTHSLDRGTGRLACLGSLGPDGCKSESL